MSDDMYVWENELSHPLAVVQSQSPWPDAYTRVVELVQEGRAAVAMPDVVDGLRNVEAQLASLVQLHLMLFVPLVGLLIATALVALRSHARSRETVVVDATPVADAKV